MSLKPTRDADATRKRLLEAARAEFAQYGIAGARVDRIATAARSNKAQIYHYFGSKDGLFDAVMDELVATVLREVPMDPRDLAGYAGRLFDGYEQRPDIYRIATWHRLERGDQAAIPAIADSNSNKSSAIAEAQARGEVSSRHAADILLGLVMHTAALWVSQTPEYLQHTHHLTVEERRAVVVTTVEGLVSPSART